MNGFLIVFEGIDGSGKTSLITDFVSILKNNLDVPVYLHKEPSIEAIKFLQKYPDLSDKEKVNIFKLDREFFYKFVVKPLISSGTTVISDRNYLSSAVYQSSSLDEAFEIINLNKPVTIEPDIYIYLDINIEEAERRILARGEEKIDTVKYESYLYKYRELLKGKNVLHIDTSCTYEDSVKELKQKWETYINQKTGDYSNGYIRL